MNKNEFLDTLRTELKFLPKEEVADIMSDYEEHFHSATKDKQSEDEIVAKLGNPTQIAKEYKTNELVKKAEENTTPRNVVRAVLATIELGFFNIIFILGPFIGALSILFAFFVTGISVAVAGIVSIVAVILSPVFPFIEIDANPVAMVLMLISMVCGGLLLTIADYYLSKLFFKLTLNYIKLNISLITNEK
jgi:uncharacterized membrane protein